jgi:hypothetical protein
MGGSRRSQEDPFKDSVGPFKPCREHDGDAGVVGETAGILGDKGFVREQGNTELFGAETNSALRKGEGCTIIILRRDEGHIQAETRAPRRTTGSGHGRSNTSTTMEQVVFLSDYDELVS